MSFIADEYRDPAPVRKAEPSAAGFSDLKFRNVLAEPERKFTLPSVEDLRRKLKLENETPLPVPGFGNTGALQSAIDFANLANEQGRDRPEMRRPATERE